MTKLQLLALVGMFCAGVTTASAQTYKFKTSGFSVLEKNDKGKWVSGLI